MTDLNQMMFLSDSTLTEFTAEVVEVFQITGQKFGVILDHTFFYPTGGGQEYDTGKLGGITVFDVTKELKPGFTVHVTDQPVPLGSIDASIDRERRLRHMQNHTAQHLLTQCFIQLYDLETLSANINGFSASTLDLPWQMERKIDYTQVELLANSIIYKNLPVKVYFIDKNDLERIPLRKVPTVEKDIRIVEISSYDYTPCGGTHCTATGQIGLLKILKTERQNDRLRVSFSAGLPAFKLLSHSFEVASQIAAKLNTSFNDLPASIIRQQEEFQSLQKQNQELKTENMMNEGDRLINSAEEYKDRKIIISNFTNRPVNELRILSDRVRKNPAVISVFSTYDGTKISYVVSCGQQTGISARELLHQLLQHCNGRGGGDSSLAQGGGSVLSNQLIDLTTEVKRVTYYLLDTTLR